MASKKETAPAKNLPSHGVFVIEGEGDKAFWTKVGCAWQHQDGNGFNITLNAVPLTGRLVLRSRKEQ
jgi:hypothetical protein